MAKFANFEINIEMKELKIHVKGDREIAPGIASNVAHQISTIFQPSGLLEAPKDGQDVHRAAESQPVVILRKKRRAVAAKSGPNGGDATSIDWTHDAAKWGTPIQAWTQPQKINWLLFVVEQVTGKSAGLTPVEMFNIFSTKFRDSGLLTRTNIGRDLRKNSEYFGSVDGRWFLKQAGKDAAAKLVGEAKGEKPTG